MAALPLLMILLFVCLPILSGQDLSKISLSIKANNKELHEVLDDLSDQCGYYFTFDSRLVDSEKKISMNLKDISLQSAIDTLFENKNLGYTLIDNNIVIFPLSTLSTPNKTDTIAHRKKSVEVNGKIVDLKSGKALPFASIGVLDTYYGTISNDDGTFILKIPDTLNLPVLVSSYIGYKNQYTPISFNRGEPVLISMNKNIISLQEVIIRYQDPESLLAEAINRIGENYMQEPAGMQAYYREKVRKDDKCMLFSEAVVEISKASYANSLAVERARLLKGRTFRNLDFQDTIILKIQSGLNSMLQLDIIKNPPVFLSEDFHALYNLSFSDVVSFRNKLVYVISFVQKENINELLYRGELYIDRESLAIIAADFKYDPMRISRESDLFVTKKSRSLKIRPLSAEYHVEYKQTGESYHLSQAQGEVRFNVRKRREWIASKYRINLEMAVTNVKPGNPPRIRPGEQIKAASIMSDQVFEYDLDFWGDYTTIAPEASLTETLKRIEKSMNEAVTKE